MTTKRLNPSGVRAFLTGRVLDCFDPTSGALAASIEYRENGTCHAAMTDGRTDEGQYGFERDLYWTRYSWFRCGGLFRFYLEQVDDNTCQAYFEDGTVAFLQRIQP